jgi:hypothetical protein
LKFSRTIICLCMKDRLRIGTLRAGRFFEMRVDAELTDRSAHG